jgi:beta-N-acetylhexosaminidase
VAERIAERSITLAHDRSSLVPIAEDSTKRILSITYADPADLVAGRWFDRVMSERQRGITTSRVDLRTTHLEYASLHSQADSADLLLVSVYVSPREFAGTLGTQQVFSRFLEDLALSGKPIIVISFGSPYLLSAFPSVSSYVLAWGGAPVSQRAAALAVLGYRGIDGRLPISLPPIHSFGAGTTRLPIRTWTEIR